MSEQKQAAEMEAENIVTEDKGQEAAAQSDVSASEVEPKDMAQAEVVDADGDKPPKETSKERREREKAYKRRLREEAAAAQAKAEQASARLDTIRKAGEADREPLEKDFDDYTEFVAARSVWRHANKANQREVAQADNEAKEAQRQAEEARQREMHIASLAWQQQIVDARTRYADFDQVALSPLIPVNEAMVEVLRGTDNAADIAYHLGSNIDVAREIAQMQPLEAARALGRIEATLQAPKPRTETKAPEPITPVRGKAAASRTPEDMNMADYRKWRRGK